MINFLVKHLRLPILISLCLLQGGCTSRRAESLTTREIQLHPPILTMEQGPFEDRFEGDLLLRLGSSPGSERFSVLVDLTRQVDIFALGKAFSRNRTPKRERREIVITVLDAVATAQQATLQSYLDEKLDAGVLDSVDRVAIVNRLLVEGSAAGILDLALQPGVALVREDWTSDPESGGRNPRPASAASTGLGEKFESWGPETIGAPVLWSQGLRGQGVVVGSIDTGVMAGHEQLQGRRLDDPRGWYDPVKRQEKPYDNHGHGTSVLSLAVGANTGGKVLGCAPDASWTHALGNWNNYYSRRAMTLAADWMLRVGRPDVIINAWSDPYGDCNDFDLPFINAWKAAEMFVVFPAGNRGPDPGSDESPANLSGVYPDGRAVFSVGALANGSGALAVQNSSSRGPNSCSNLPFPTLSAPGDRLPFASPPTPAQYRTGRGTSLAAGLVGGGVALLIQADPDLLVADLEEIVQETSRDLPPAGKDPATGAGIIDLPAALREIRERRKSQGRNGSVAVGPA